jgi:hypothetical protein
MQRSDGRWSWPSSFGGSFPNMRHTASFLLAQGVDLGTVYLNCIMYFAASWHGYLCLPNLKTVMSIP